MRFYIEIGRGNGARNEILHRVSVNEISAKWANAKATALLNVWGPRGAAGARVLSDRNQILYSLTPRYAGSSPAALLSLAPLASATEAPPLPRPSPLPSSSEKTGDGCHVNCGSPPPVQ